MGKSIVTDLRNAGVKINMGPRLFDAIGISGKPQTDFHIEYGEPECTIEIVDDVMPPLSTSTPTAARTLKSSSLRTRTPPSASLAASTRLASSTMPARASLTVTALAWVLRLVSARRAS